MNRPSRRPRKAGFRGGWAAEFAKDGLGVRELARRVGRDVKGVHTDAQALVACGVIEKTEDGKLLFPYDEVRLELRLKAA